MDHIWINTAIDVSDSRKLPAQTKEWGLQAVIIVGSLLVHMLALWLFALDNTKPKVKAPVSAIKATLIFPQAIETPPTQELPVTAEEPIKKIVEPKQVEATPSPETDTTRAPQPTAQQVEGSTTQTHNKQAVGLSNKTAAFIQQQRIQRDGDLLKSAVQSRQQTMYQQRRPADYVYEPKSLQEQLVKKVNCDANTTKGVVMLSSLFGGTVRCTSTPAIDGYIDKRVNKTP